MLVTQHSPGVGRRLDEQPVLDGDQLDRTTGKARPAVGVVDNPISQHVGLSQLGHRPLAQGRPDPRRKLIRREGFDDVIHGPHIEGPAMSSSRPQVGGEDNRQVARSEDVLHQLDPVGPRRHQVEQDKIGHLLFYEAECPLRVPGHNRHVACAGEGVTNAPEHLRVVLHLEYAYAFAHRLR